MKLASFELSSGEMVANSEITATVRLDAAAPATGVAVMLGASASAVKVPNKVVVPPGQIEYTFIIGSGSLLPLIEYQVWAQVEETVFRRRISLRNSSILGAVFVPSVVDGGNTVTLTLTLDSQAPSTGALVLLSEVLNYDGEATPLITDLPLSAYFASGDTVKNITVTTRDWDAGSMPAPRQVNTAVDALLDGVSKRAILTITDL